MSDIKKSTDSPTGLKKRLAITFVLLNILVFSLAGLSLYQSRIKYEKLAEVSTRNLASVLENHINGEINSIDMALVAAKYEAEGQIARGGIDSETLNRYMARQLSYLPSLFGLWMSNSRGDVIYKAGDPGIVTNIVDRDYFIFERDNPKGDLFIAKPVLGRASKKWVLNIARRINNPDGSFAGTIFGNLTIDHLIDVFSAIDVGKMGAVTLRDSELAVIARYPEPKGVGSTIGNKNVVKEFSDQIKAGNKSATIKSRARIDDTERLYSYRKIANYPLFIVVALAKDEYLAGWRKEAVTQLVMVVFFTLITFISLRMLFSRWKREK